MTKIEKRLKPIVDYVQRETGYLIKIKTCKDNGYLLKGTAVVNEEKRNVAYIYAANLTQGIHEMGHLLSTPGPWPESGISMLLRELVAWRTSECLHHKFNIPFDEECFDEGLGSYITELVASDERPSLAWLSQLIGESSL